MQKFILREWQSGPRDKPPGPQRTLWCWYADLRKAEEFHRVRGPQEHYRCI